MICMFAGIAKCTPASLALFCRALGLLQALFPIPVLGGQTKLKFLISVFYPRNTKREGEKAKAVVLASVSISAAAWEDSACRGKPTPQPYGHLLLGNRPVSGGPVSQLWIFLYLKGCFFCAPRWRLTQELFLSWPVGQLCLPSAAVAAASPSWSPAWLCWEGGACPGTKAALSMGMCGALGALLAMLPLWVGFCPPVWGKWQHSKGLCWRKTLQMKVPVCLTFLTRCVDRREHKHQRCFQADSDCNQFLPVG